MTTWLTRAAAAVLFVWFLATSFRTGWTQSATDFPNYYTAAVAVREHQPLRNFYDWRWFNQQVIHAGIEGKIGAYAPLTPLSMLPMIPLAGLPPQTGKRVWITANLILLAAAIYLLARASRKPFEWIALLVLAGHNSLASNFIYGQYYVFLLFLFTLIFHFRARAAGGLISGVTFALKLYTGPLLLFYLAKRNWRSAGTMLFAIACAGILAIAMFGWRDVLYYPTHVLPRALEDGAIDPYNPGVPTFSTMLRHMFMREPVLNPNSVLDKPWLFFFLRTAVHVGLIAFTTLGVAYAKSADDYRDFAWFVILAVLLSTHTASYSFILLLLPVVLLLRDASMRMSVFLVASYILLNSNLQPIWLFPKVQLLVLLFTVVGWQRIRGIPNRTVIGATIALVTIAGLDAQRHMRAYLQEPGRRFELLPTKPGSLYSGSPVISQAGLFFEAMGTDRYVICKLQGELECGFLGSIAKSRDMATSPDGRWEAFTMDSGFSQRLWLKDRRTGLAAELAGGDCNSGSPAWEIDSSAVVFASDCGRAFGLTALYRARVE